MDISSVTKHVSKLRDIFPLNSASTNNANTPQRTQVIKEEMNDGENSNLDVTMATIPDDQSDQDLPIHLLDEARIYYRGQRPPFVVKNLSKARQTRKVQFATESGQRSTVPQCGEVVARPWNKENMLLTLDLNNTRYIVKPCSGGSSQGGAGGAMYLKWAGPTIGFEKKPLAFSQVHLQRPDDSSASADPESSAETMDESDDQAVQNQTASARSVVQQDSTSVARIAPGELPPPARLGLESGIIPTPSDSDGVAQPAKSGTVSETRNALSHGKRPTRNADLPARLIVEGARNKRRKTDIPVRELNSLFADASLPPIRRRTGTHGAVTFLPGSSPELGSQTVSQPDQMPNSSNPSPPPSQPLASSINLTDHKLKRTTFLVRIPPSAEFQPLIFSDRPNMATFYAKVLDIWAVPEDGAAKVTITFNWKDPEDRMRVMVLNRKNEASFPFLLKQIDDYPRWGDGGGGECQLDVDICLK